MSTGASRLSLSLIIGESSSYSGSERDERDDGILSARKHSGFPENTNRDEICESTIQLINGLKGVDACMELHFGYDDGECLYL